MRLLRWYAFGGWVRACLGLIVMGVCEVVLECWGAVGGFFGRLRGGAVQGHMGFLLRVVMVGGWGCERCCFIRILILFLHTP